MSPGIRNTIPALDNDIKTEKRDNCDSNGQLCPKAEKSTIFEHTISDIIEQTMTFSKTAILK